MPITIRLDSSISFALVLFAILYILLATALFDRILLGISRFTKNFFYGFDVLLVILILILAFVLFKSPKK